MTWLTHVGRDSTAEPAALFHPRRLLGIAKYIVANNGALSTSPLQGTAFLHSGLPKHALDGAPDATDTQIHFIPSGPIELALELVGVPCRCCIEHACDRCLVLHGMAWLQGTMNKTGTHTDPSNLPMYGALLIPIVLRPLSRYVCVWNGQGAIHWNARKLATAAPCAWCLLIHCWTPRSSTTSCRCVCDFVQAICSKLSSDQCVYGVPFIRRSNETWMCLWQGCASAEKLPSEEWAGTYCPTHAAHTHVPSCVLCCTILCGTRRTPAMAKVLSHEIIDESIPHDPESTVRYQTVVRTMVAFSLQAD